MESKVTMVLRVLIIFLFTSSIYGQKLINKIEINGNVAFSDQRIQDILFSKEGEELLNYKVNRDKRLIENFYKRNGYIEVEVTLQSVPFSVENNQQIDNIVFTIKENFQSKFGNLIIKGNSAVRTDELEARFNGQSGQPYSVNIVKFFLEDIRELYKTNGYPNLEIDLEQPTQPGNNFIKDIVVTIIENNIVYFRNVHFKGPTDSIPLITNQELIEQEIEFHTGDLYDENKVRETQKYLYDLNLFQNVSISFELINGQDIDSMDVIIALTERKTSYVAISAGLTTDYGLSNSLNDIPTGDASFFEKFTYEGNFDAGKRNWRGTGAEIGLGVNPVWYFAENSQKTGSDFTNFSNKFRVYSNFLNFPFHRWQSFVELSQLRIDHPDLGSFSRFNSNYRATRKLGLRSLIDFTFSNDVNEITPGNRVLDINDRRRLGLTDNNIFSFGISYRLDERNDQINPKRGFNLLSSIKASATSGLEKNAEDVVYYTAQLEWRRYQPFILDKKLTLATNLRGGVIFSGDKSKDNFDLIPIFDRFYMGNSLRGFVYNQFGTQLAIVDTVNNVVTDYTGKGGRIIFVSNLELRYELMTIWDNQLYMQTFVDIGALWEEFEDIKFKSIRMTYGFGLSYYLKLLVLRIDYGFIHDPRRLDVENLSDLPAGVKPRNEDQGTRGEYSFGISFHF